MKKILIPLFVLISTMGNAQTAAHNLVVNIGNFKTDNGLAYVTMRDPNLKVIQTLTAKVVNGTTQVVFKNVPTGKYAVRLFQDKNDNKILDYGFFGIPKESWGVSNNVKPSLTGPPKYEDMLFTLDKDNTIAISMN
jgi:uncharacterized protein (DUF2141 family)